MLPAPLELESERADPISGRVVLGRYRIICPLGRGGTGVVYLGRTEGAAGFSKPVVVKRLLPNLLGDPQHAQMLVREAHILAALRHSGIVGVVDLGEEDGAYVMVIEYVHGYDLGQWLKFLKLGNRRLPVDAALEISIRVLDALHHAHTLKHADGAPAAVIHRDISPSNILLDLDGSVRILDFGIAHVISELPSGVNGANQFKGKFGYSHPSLLKLGLPSPMTDTYSAAVVLFRMLAGVNPFYGESIEATIDRVLNSPTPRLRQYRSDVSSGLEEVLFKALSPKLDCAYPSALALAQALDQQRTLASAGANAALSKLVESDFLGEMPKMLGLETLAERDAAWRSFDREEGAGLRTKSRSPDSAGSTVIHGRRATQPQLGAEPPPRARPPAVEPVAEPTSLRASQQRPRSRRNEFVGWTLGVVALSLATAAATLANRRTSDARYLVVSAQGELSHSQTPLVPKAEPEPLPAPTALSGRVEAVPASSASNASAPNASKAPSNQVRRSPDSTYLTQVFASRQPQVHACFTRTDTGAPSVNVQLAFQVDMSGKVQKVTLSPASVASSRLGRCLLDVAGSTRFGRLTESASFRIPVRASRQ